MSVWVLNHHAPLEYPGVHLDRDRCVRVYRGDDLPAGLANFRAGLYTWERHIEDRLNHRPPMLHHSGPTLPLRDYQEDQVARIREAYDKKSPGYLLNYTTGSGKTPISVVSADLIANKESSILVIAKISTIPAWRKAITRFAVNPHRWVVINPERMWMLFRHSDHSVKLANISYADRPAVMAHMGVSEVLWHTVIIDEAQILASAESQRARLVRRLEAEYRIFATATPFTSPYETSYVADLIAYAAGVSPPEDIEEDYSEWLRLRGLRLLPSEGTRRWMHGINTGDVSLLTSYLYARGVGASKGVDELGMPKQVRRLVPIELTPDQRRQYNQAWLDFLEEFGGLEANSMEPSMPVSQVLRAVQRASLLKLPALAELIADCVQDGYQVCVPMFFLRSVQELATLTAKELHRRKLPERVITMTGEDNRGLSSAGHDVRERKRQAFQLGHAWVAIFNGHEGINLQAGERDVVPGKDATSRPRITLFGDVLTGGKRVLQAEGRAHRDNQAAPAHYVYADGTAEAEWLALVFEQASNTKALSNDHADAQNLAELAAQLRADSFEMAS